MSKWRDNLDISLEKYLSENELTVLETDETINEFKDKILDEYEEDISILQHNYNCKKSENEIIHKRLKLLTYYLKLQGHTDAQINEIIKLRGE